MTIEEKLYLIIIMNVAVNSKDDKFACSEVVGSSPGSGTDSNKSTPDDNRSVPIGHNIRKKSFLKLDCSSRDLPAAHTKYAVNKKN